MKKTRSFSLELDMYEEIVEYKDKYKLSSVNIALERMLLERRNILNLLNGKELIKAEESTINIQNTREIVEENSVLKKSLSDSYNNMPD